MRATVVCSMRNEGPFIVEWVAWYKMLGFKNIVVVTNNCTDHSPQLLDALQAAGWLFHVRHDVPPGEPVTLQKLAVAKQHPRVRRADWVLVCDVDEFLVIHKGEGRLTDLVGQGDPAFLGMAINWKVFGTARIAAFADIPVHRQFFAASAPARGLSRFVKTLFRKPDWFGVMAEHGPRRLNLTKAGQDWGAPGMAWVNARGDVVPRWTPEGEYVRMIGYEDGAHEVAQINHYMLRSVETYSLKSGTLSPVARTARYSPKYFQRANRGDEIDTSALRYAAAFDARHAAAMALPDVARLHNQCCADHLRLIAQKLGRDVADDPRHAMFTDRAGA